MLKIYIYLCIAFTSFLYLLFRYKNMVILTSLEGFTNKFKCFVPWNERSKEYLPINCCYWNWIIKNNCIISFLYFFYICLWNLKLRISKKYIWSIKSRVKKQPMSWNIEPSRNYYIVCKSTRKITYIFLPLLHFYILLKKLFIVFTE